MALDAFGPAAAWILAALPRVVKQRPAAGVVPHRRDEILRPRSPAGDGPDGLGERDVERVHARPFEDVDGPGKRRGNRRHEDRQPAVVELFDDERRDERVLDLDERRLSRRSPRCRRRAAGSGCERGRSRGAVRRTSAPVRSRTTRPARVRTAAPTAKQMPNTSRSDNRRSAGTQSGSSAVNGRTRPATVFMPLSSRRTAR